MPTDRTVINESLSYLNSAIRTYVTARKTIDKLLAIKLVVLAMVIAADYLISFYDLEENYNGEEVEQDKKSISSIVGKKKSSYSKDWYEMRIKELRKLTKSFPNQQFDTKLVKAIDTFTQLEEKGPDLLKNILAINLKEFINNAQEFIYEVKFYTDGF